MMAANLAFLINDTQVKLAGGLMPMGEIIFLRGIFTTLVIGGVVVALGDHRAIATLFHRTLLWRTLCEVGAVLLFLTALFRMPIADITVILQIIPLMITAGSACFLAERVGWRRWTAIAVGFVGVVIVIRPGGEGFNAYALLAFGAALVVAMRDLVTRTMPAVVPTTLVAALSAIAVTLAGAGLGIGEDWVVPDQKALGLAAGAGVFIAAGYGMAIVAMRHGEIATVSPFRYSVIVWAIIVGYLVWGEVPDMLTLVGTTIIISTGIYTLYRERQLSAVPVGPQL